MNNYFLLHENPVSCGYCTNISKSDNDVDSELVLGRRLLTDQPLSPGLIEYVKNEYVLWIEPKDYDKPMLDYYSLGTDHIVSDRLKNILDKHNVNAECIPIKVLDDTNNTAGEFYLAHFLTLIDCLDYKNSAGIDGYASYEPGSNVIALSEDQIPDGVLLFRENKIRYRVLVHELLKDAFEAADTKGILFLPLPVDGWETGQLIRKLEADCAKKNKTGRNT